MPLYKQVVYESNPLRWMLRKWSMVLQFGFNWLKFMISGKLSESAITKRYRQEEN
jgi:hypothetical protein